MKNTKLVLVCCAIIIKEGKVLVTQRSAAQTQALKWEFPGGKIEADESAEDCIKREIREELALEIRILKSLKSSTYSYPEVTICLVPFVAEIISGTLVLNEHLNFAWLNFEELITLDWAAADVPVLHDFLKYYN